MKIRSPDTLILGHVKINSIRNNYDSLAYMLTYLHVDIFLISETKLDDSFPSAQFKIGYTTPYRYDRNDKVGNLILTNRPNLIPTKQCF